MLPPRSVPWIRVPSALFSTQPRRLAGPNKGPPRGTPTDVSVTRRPSWATLLYHVDSRTDSADVP